VQYTLTDPETGRLRQVNWMAPSLNDVTLRMTDEQIYDVLVYGRPFSPMPAWGLEGGGPMNDQQLDNLIAYMKSIAITPEEAQAQAAERAEVELERLQEGGTTGGTGTGAGGVPSEGQPQSASLGAALFNTNCARCHTLGYSYGEAQTPGGGAFGPSLYNSTNQFPSREDQIGFVSEGAENGERYGINGQSNGRMPYFSQVLSAEQIASIVEYERLLNEREGGRTEEQGGASQDEGDRDNSNEETGETAGTGEDAEDEGGESSSQSGESGTSELEDEEENG
jgi:mono/diheme cytochrome c family protein